MVRRPAQVASGAGHVASARYVGATRVWLPPEASKAEAPTPKVILPERVSLITYANFVFEDPLWGTISFRLYVYRHDDNDLPEYEVVVE